MNMSKGQTHTKRKAGRPPIELSEGVFDLIEQYQGSATVTSLCRFLNVSNTVFYKWFNDTEDKRFYDAVMRARSRADDDVEDSFWKRAKGYEIEVVEQKLDKDGCVHDLNKEIHVVPDAGAGLNWLKNRRPDEWRDKRELEINGDHVALLTKALNGELDE